MKSAVGKAHKRMIDGLVKDYTDRERSDTFMSFNDAVVLAGEVRRLRNIVTRLNKKLRDAQVAGEGRIP